MSERLPILVVRALVRDLLGALLGRGLGSLGGGRLVDGLDRDVFGGLGGGSVLDDLGLGGVAWRP